MSSTHAQPEKHGSGAHAHAPQVAVREGNRLLCPCCGEVLFLLKETSPVGPACRGSDSGYQDSDPRSREVHTPPESIEDDEPGYRADGLVCEIDPEVEAYEIPEEDPPPAPVLPTFKEPRKRSTEPRPPRVRDDETRWRERQRYRLKRPLRVPTHYEGRRLLAWTFYRLKALDLQLQREIREKEAQIEQLRAELRALKETAAKEARAKQAADPIAEAKRAERQKRREENQRLIEEAAVYYQDDYEDEEDDGDWDDDLADEEEEMEDDYEEDEELDDDNQPRYNFDGIDLSAYGLSQENPRGPP